MLRVHVLGDLALELDGESLDPPAGRRARELLGWLALNPGPHARSELAARFWPDVLDSSARASLRTALHDLRRGLGAASGQLTASRGQVEPESSFGSTPSSSGGSCGTSNSKTRWPSQAVSRSWDSTRTG